ncbi:hypothetical protein C9413_27550 [Rhizobium sp. SEMIA 4085]|uniref:hypothetical protein n=1 Tax=Rhizobium sp. SEMIA 4085 TaxID=2137761 RepID=UPI00147967C8|nr:hypothetical protein [Rhizobium sp. SEMIA 4085]NNH33050.1 hypothetical protein [Rhizobium sp. SEMIA 4085]
MSDVSREIDAEHRARIVGVVLDLKGAAGLDPLLQGVEFEDRHAVALADEIGHL